MAQVFDEGEIRRVARLDAEALAAVERAFVWASEGRAEIPPVLHLSVEEGPGDLDVKGAYVRGLPRFALKVATGFHGNAALGLPTGGGLMVVFSASTGVCEAVLLDGGYLTDLRTALAGAVAAKHLAPATVRTAGVVGAGAQARFQLRALQLVRPYERALVWARRAEKAEAFAAEMSEVLGVSVVAAPSAEEVVRECECVVTTTPAREPLVRAEWLHPGLHLTAMGSDGPGKQELDPALFDRADRRVCDLRRQGFSIGELQHWSGDQDAVAELGEVVAGSRPGRADEGEITICDLTGIGTQDTAIALHTIDLLA